MLERTGVATDDEGEPMSNGDVRPVDELLAVDAAFAMFLGAIAGLTDTEAHGASLLPGWSRGHVLTHVARSGDADARTVEGAIRGEVLDKYPGGNAERTRDIEEGAGRDTETMRADLVVSQARLTAAWSRVDRDMWTRLTRTPAGPRSVAGVVYAREREILVHLVDLDVGVSVRDLPADYVERDRAWLVEYRTTATWPDAPW